MYFQNRINMKFLFSIFALLLSTNIIIAQDVNSLVAEGQRLEAALDERAAIGKFKEALKLSPQNLTALTRCSEICSSIGNRETTTKTRDAYYNAALVYAQTAVKLYPENDLSNVSMAIAVGRIVLTKSGKEKIASVKDLKMYAEKAIKANANNFKAWHILGKWHYEVSNLTGLERGAAKLLFGALPASSFATAVSCYEKAKGLNSTFILNYLELAKAYKKTGDVTKAKAVLTAMQNIKNNAADDVRIKEEGKVLLAKL